MADRVILMVYRGRGGDMYLGFISSGILYVALLEILGGCF